MEQERQEEKMGKSTDLGTLNLSLVLSVFTCKMGGWASRAPIGFVVPRLCCALGTEWNLVRESFLQSYSQLCIIVKAISLDILWNSYHQDFFT